MSYISGFVNGWYEQYEQCEKYEQNDQNEQYNQYEQYLWIDIVGPLLCDGLPANVLHSSEELAMGSMLTEWMVGREQHINYWQYFFRKSGFGSRDNTLDIKFVPYEKLCINFEYFSENL